ncbi:MAG: IS91-like element ISMbu9 family transposase, partial [Methanosarcinaceae archaeon]
MYPTISQFKPIITVKHIFEDNNNWNTFCLTATDSLRTVEIEEVNKMLS